MRDYKPLSVAVMIFVTLVNTQTHTHMQLLTGILLAQLTS